MGSGGGVAVDVGVGVVDVVQEGMDKRSPGHEECERECGYEVR